MLWRDCAAQFTAVSRGVLKCRFVQAGLCYKRHAYLNSPTATQYWPHTTRGAARSPQRHAVDVRRQREWVAGGRARPGVPLPGVRKSRAAADAVTTVNVRLAGVALARPPVEAHALAGAVVVVKTVV